jgi:hypothetical protein
VVSKVNFEYGEKYIDLENGSIRTGFYIDNPLKNGKSFLISLLTLAEWRDKQINSILNDE